MSEHWYQCYSCCLLSSMPLFYSALARADPFQSCAASCFLICIGGFVGTLRTNLLPWKDMEQGRWGRREQGLKIFVFFSFARLID